MSVAVSSGHDDLSLQQQCLLHILMHLEQFPASSLALLPLSLRQELLINLPIADVCMLEESPFVHGIDMEDFWKGLILSRRDLPDLYPENVCPGTSETVKAISALAKARCYGLVAEYIVNNRASSWEFLDFPMNMDPCNTTEPYKIIEFLYAVRKFASRNEPHSWRGITYHNCEFLFPSRYVQFQRCYPSSLGMVDAVVHGFRGLPQILIVDGLEQQIITSGFLSDPTYLHECWPKEMDNVIAVAKMAKNLKVLILSDENRCDEGSVSLNEFCTELSRLPFLSNIHLLLIESHEETKGVDAGFVVSQQKLEDFLLAFLSTPCSHPQIIKFLRITVEDFHIPPDSTQPVPSSKNWKQKINITSI